MEIFNPYIFISDTKFGEQTLQEVERDVVVALLAFNTSDHSKQEF